jgi:hypothetical protein
VNVARLVSALSLLTFLGSPIAHAQVVTTVVNLSDIPQVRVFYMPVGARGADIRTDLSVGNVAGFSTLVFPGDYTTCTTERTFSGWYVAMGFNTDRDYMRAPYEDFSKDGLPDFHPGQDWNGIGGGNTDECQPVFAIADGVVIGSGFERGWGNMLFIVHKVPSFAGQDEFYVSVYAHLKQINSHACLGCAVQRSDEVAKIGRTGTKWAHLHWEIRKSTFLNIVGSSVQLRTSGDFRPTTWPATGRADQGQAFIANNYCEPSTFVRDAVCRGGCREGDACDDGDACTRIDTCRGGICVGSDPVTCAALDQCHTVGACDPTSGRCSNPAKENGAACDDGSACTLNDTCSGGACVPGVPRNCDDGDPCTLDSCDSSKGCVRTPNPACSVCAGAAFCDDFNRPDSSTVGNGWSEVELSPADARLLNSRLNFSTNDGAVVYRPQSPGAEGSNVTLTWVYRNTGAFQVEDGVSVRWKPEYNGGRYIVRGLNARISVANNLIELRDDDNIAAPVKAATHTFPFELNTDYNFQWDIYADNGMNLWAWRTADARPSTPTLTVSPFTPISNGTYWAIGNRGGSFFDDFRVETPARPRPFSADSAFTNFSSTSNPSGNWSYGLTPSLGGPFGLYAGIGFTIPLSPLPTWSTPAGGVLFLGANTSGSTYTNSFATVPAGFLILHPSGAGEYSVLRWTAPASGTYTATGFFQGVGFIGSGTTTDVHVLRNGVPIADAASVPGLHSTSPCLWRRGAP